MNHTEYQKKVKGLSEAELRYIIKDASEALKALPDSPKAGYYQDEINYCANELHRRRKRPIYEIAQDIQLNWHNPYFGAKPYLEAMFCLDKPTDTYGYESATTIINYFLCNASTWKGETAKQIKKELKNLVK